MYNSQSIAERIKSTAKSQKKSLGSVLSVCGLGINTISELSKGKQISYINFAKIADELNCSVDYLLGRTDVPEVNQRDNLIPIYTAARSQNGQYSRAGVEYVDQETLNRLRNAPEADEDL